MIRKPEDLDGFVGLRIYAVDDRAACPGGTRPPAPRDAARRSRSHRDGRIVPSPSSIAASTSPSGLEAEEVAFPCAGRPVVRAVLYPPGRLDDLDRREVEVVAHPAHALGVMGEKVQPHPIYRLPRGGRAKLCEALDHEVVTLVGEQERPSSKGSSGTRSQAARGKPPSSSSARPRLAQTGWEKRRQQSRKGATVRGTVS